MKDAPYHRILRISALTLALLLLFDSGVLLPVTAQLSQDTQQYLATVIGVNAGVAPTELNQITAQLTQRQTDLDAREAVLQAREISVNLNGEGGTVDYSSYILSVLLFVILVLIVLNYFLDYRRARRTLMQQTHEKMA